MKGPAPGGEFFGAFKVFGPGGNGFFSAAEFPPVLTNLGGKLPGGGVGGMFPGADVGGGGPINFEGFFKMMMAK
eukprot:UN2155